MNISRLSFIATALLALVCVGCASEAPAEPAPIESMRAASTPTQAPTPAAVQQAPTRPPTPTAMPEERDLDIVTLLPFDAIPAVLDPTFISAEDAESKLAKRGGNPNDALVLGLSIDGDSRAYYIPSLSAVEIINDTVGGQPLAVTW